MITISKPSTNRDLAAARAYCCQQTDCVTSCCVNIVSKGPTAIVGDKKSRRPGEKAGLSKQFTTAIRSLAS